MLSRPYNVDVIVDATSFAVMEREGTKTVFAFDPDS